MIEVAFGQYDACRMKVAQQLPVLLVERGRWSQANDEVLTYVHEFSVGQAASTRSKPDKHSCFHQGADVMKVLDNAHTQLLHFGGRCQKVRHHDGHHACVGCGTNAVIGIL